MSSFFLLFRFDLDENIAGLFVRNSLHGHACVRGAYILFVATSDDLCLIRVPSPYPIPLAVLSVWFGYRWGKKRSDGCGYSSR